MAMAIEYHARQQCVCEESVDGQDHYLFTPPIPTTTTATSSRSGTLLPIHGIPIRVHELRLPLIGQQLPQLPDSDALDRQHAILQTIQIRPMNRGDELARHQTKKHSRGEVVFPETVA